MHASEEGDFISGASGLNGFPTSTCRPVVTAGIVSVCHLSWQVAVFCQCHSTPNQLTMAAEGRRTDNYESGRLLPIRKKRETK